MKKSDVDTIIQGLAPALHAFVSQKLAPVSERVVNIEIAGAATRETAEQVGTEVARMVAAAKAEPIPAPVVEPIDVMEVAKAVVALLPPPPLPKKRKKQFDIQAFNDILESAPL